MITLVCGLPGSGKTSWSRARQAETGGYVIDLDQILDGMAGCAPHTMVHNRHAYFLFSEWIHKLAQNLEYGVYYQNYKVDERNIYIIRTAPNEGEMRRYGLNCARVLIDTDPDICLERCKARGDYREEAFAESMMRLKSYRDRYGGITRTIESANACGFQDSEGSK